MIRDDTTDRDNPVVALPAGLGRKYRVRRRLGAGGYGSVYLAIQLGLDRPVALKLLRADAHAADAQALGRFANEALITAALSHPGIVRVLDAGVTDETPWIAYEYVPGRDLRQILEDRSPGWARAVEFIRQVAAALHEAHSHGILHRDVKPENILVTDSDLCKVTDFGIAKWGGAGAVRTQAGLILGTPAYISPEQVAGREPIAASDIYSLGVVLFELLAGKPPFTAAHPLRLLECHLRETPPRLCELAPGAPAELDGIVSKALAKAPSDRYTSAGELGDALAGLIGRGSPAPACGPKSRPRATRRGRERSPVTARTVPPRGLLLGATATVCFALLAIGQRVLTPVFAPPGVHSTTAGSEREVVVRLLHRELRVQARGGREGRERPLEISVPLPARYPLRIALPVRTGSSPASNIVTVTAGMAAEALLNELRGLEAHVTRASTGTRLKTLSGSTVRSDPAAVEEYLSAGGLVDVWKIAATHAASILESELPWGLRRQVAIQLQRLEDLALCLEAIKVKIPPDLLLRYPPRWNPHPAAPPCGSRSEPLRFVRHLPCGRTGQLLDDLFTSKPEVRGLLLVTSTDIGGARIPRHQTSDAVRSTLVAGVDLGSIQTRIDPRDPGLDFGAFAPDTLVARVALPADLLDQANLAWLEVRFLAQRAATLRVRVNDLAVIRPWPAGSIPLGHQGTVQSIHTLDPHVLKPGENELVFEAVKVADHALFPWMDIVDARLGLCTRDR